MTNKIKDFFGGEAPPWFKTLNLTLLTIISGAILTVLISMNANLASNNTKIDGLQQSVAEQNQCFEKYSDKTDQRITKAENNILRHDFEIKELKKKVN